jgi:hypothetical protein
MASYDSVSRTWRQFSINEISNNWMLRPTTRESAKPDFTSSYCWLDDAENIQLRRTRTRVAYIPRDLDHRINTTGEKGTTHQLVSLK